MQPKGCWCASTRVQYWYVLVPAPGMSLRGGVGMYYWLGFIIYVAHSGKRESWIVTLALLADFVAICPRKSERDLRFSGQSLCSKEEEVVIEEGEEEKKGKETRH